jgi:hypothetical protein
MKRLIFSALFCTFAFAGPSDSASAAKRANSKTSAVVELVARVDREGPIRLDWIKRMFGAAVQCDGDSERTYCEGIKVTVGGVKLSKVDFRQTELGSLLILDFNEQCASVSELRARFSWQSVENGCTDGAICMYAETKRRWGKLSVGLPDKPSSTCAKSVIFDAFPN